MRMAYLTGRYPAVSHTFISREVESLRTRGVDVRTFSIWTSSPDQLLTEGDREEARATYAVLPLRPLRALRAHLRAFRASSGAYVRLFRDALALAPAGLRGRALGASWFVEAADLWARLESEGIRHVHVHLNGTAPAVALLLTDFANRAATDATQWTWSLTVHGPAEFFDVERERLADKVRSASLVVCISDFARSQLMSLVDEEHWGKLRIVHCGVDPELFTAAPVREAQGTELLSVARLTQVKGQAVLLEALAEIVRRGVDARLTIIGDGPKRGDLERIAARLGIQDRVTFAGAVGQDRIRDYYQRADVFCLSSFAEGVPVVLMEAMATGVPVVAPRIMGIAELIEDGVSGLLVRPGRPDQIAESISRLAGDAALCSQLGEAGRETILREFDIRRSGEQLQSLFGSVVSG